MLLSALLATSLSSCREKPSDPDRTYYSELRAVKKLVVGRMTLSKMATIDDIRLSEAQGLKQTASALLAAIKPGSRKAAYSYDTYLRAYIDLEKLTPADISLSADGKRHAAHTSGHRNRIHRPRCRDTRRALSSHRTAPEINADERAALKEEMNRLLKEEVRQNPAFTSRLTELAKTKAVTYFTQWGRSRA